MTAQNLFFQTVVMVKQHNIQRLSLFHRKKNLSHHQPLKHENPYLPNRFLFQLPYLLDYLVG